MPIVSEVDNEELQSGNEITKEVFALIDERKEFFLTSTVVGGVNAIRVVAVNPLAEEKYIRQVFELLVATTEETVAKRS